MSGMMVIDFSAQSSASRVEWQGEVRSGHWQAGQGRGEVREGLEGGFVRVALMLSGGVKLIC